MLVPFQAKYSHRSGEICNVGKTHLAVGLALKALEAGKVVYYTVLSYLIEDLKSPVSGTSGTQMADLSPPCRPGH